MGRGAENVGRRRVHRRACPGGNAARPAIGARGVRAVTGKNHWPPTATQSTRPPEKRTRARKGSIRIGADGTGNGELRILSPVYGPRFPVICSPALPDSLPI